MNQIKVTFDFLSAKQDRLVFEGRAVLPNSRFPVALFARNYAGVVVGGVMLNPSSQKTSSGKGGKETPFELDTPAKDINFEVVIQGKAVPASYKTGKFFPVSFKVFSYAEIGPYIVSSMLRNRPGLRVRVASSRRRMVSEFLFELKASLKDPSSRTMLKHRRFALAKRKTKTEKEQVWLIYDRPTFAGDNGEALFSYLNMNPHEGLRPIFILSRDSVDWERMMSRGEVVVYGSDEHIRLHLLADVVVSSSADETAIFPIGRHRRLFSGISNPKFVFLQHGVIHNDLSDWLNRWNKNISLFLTSTLPEWESIALNASYGYAKEQILLTGLPRHDYLLQRQGPPERRVLVAPTWRKWLVGEPDGVGRRILVDGFRETEYFQFWYSLVNDDRVVAMSRECGFRIVLLLHPAIASAAELFEGKECEVIAEQRHPVELFRASVFVTDYSSVAFDFAQLRRPMVYAQFDRDCFEADHTSNPGYFDYERDGFGVVTTEYEATVYELLRCMSSLEMPEEYQSRVAAAFSMKGGAFFRCEEIVERIYDHVRKDGAI